MPINLQQEMLSKTKAILLHYIKYGESGVIAYCYTRHFGRVSLIVQGVRRKKSRVKLNLLQPLQINEIDFYYKEKPGLMHLKEIRSCHLANGLLFDTRKSSVSMFMAEVLYKTLKEEVKNKELFQFVEDSIVRLEKLEKGYTAFYLKFMLDYCMYLGFYPNMDNYGNASHFDLRNGVFTAAGPAHEFFISGDLMQAFAQLLKADADQIHEVTVPNRQRDRLLDILLDYYMLHMEGFATLKSIPVLRELFHG